MGHSRILRHHAGNNTGNSRLVAHCLQIPDLTLNAPLTWMPPPSSALRDRGKPVERSLLRWDSVAGSFSFRHAVANSGARDRRPPGARGSRPLEGAASAALLLSASRGQQRRPGRAPSRSPRLAACGGRRFSFRHTAASSGARDGRPPGARGSRLVAGAWDRRLATARGLQGRCGRQQLSKLGSTGSRQVRRAELAPLELCGRQQPPSGLFLVWQVTDQEIHLVGQDVPVGQDQVFHPAGPEGDRQ